MSDENQAEKLEAQVRADVLSPTVSAEKPWSTASYLWLAFAGVAAPLLGYLAALMTADLMTLVWLPFVVHSEVSIVMVLAEPTLSREKFGVRLGIYTGLFLTILPWLMMSLSPSEGFVAVLEMISWFGEPTRLPLAGVIGPVIWGMVVWAVLAMIFWLGRKSGKLLAAILLGLPVAIIVTFWLDGPMIPFMLFGAPLILTLTSVPVWAILSFGLMSYYVFRHSEAGRPWQFSIQRLLLLTTWIALLLSTWRISISLQPAP